MLALDSTKHEEAHHAGEHADEKKSADLYDWAPNPNRSSDCRCPSCDGPSLDGNRCQACRSASATEPTNTAAATVGDAAVATSLSQGSIDRATAVKSESRPRISDTVTSTIHDTVKAKILEPEKATTQDGMPRRTAADAVYAERLRKPAAAVPKRPQVPPPVPVAPPPQRPPIALVAALVVVGAIAVGVYWRQLNNKPVIGQQQTIETVVAANNAMGVGDAGARPLPAERSAVPSAPVGNQDRTPEAAKSRSEVATSPAENPRSSTTAPRKDPAKTGSKSAVPSPAPRRTAVPVVAEKSVRSAGPIGEVQARAIASDTVVARPAVNVIERVSRPEPAAAAGPFFETRDVSETPRIATQRQPKLPPELRSRAIKEVVVVRALVSQAGHPSRISLLRRSKTGPELDDLVLASVNDWTFSPARKKGEPVSCWFNFAVQVGGAE